MIASAPCNVRCRAAGMCLPWIWDLGNFYLLRDPPPLGFSEAQRAVRVCTSASYTHTLQLLAACFVVLNTNLAAYVAVT